MDCWIASFPRSGNTYFRNILYYVYGIESSTWHNETAYPVDENYDSYRFVKTHLLPKDLIPDDPSIPAIYLVRDGRDAVVSIAHHRKDLVNPGSDFLMNLQEAIVAAEGSFFGGWSKNAQAWIQRAQLIIRYEDLIADPVAVFKRVEKLIPLPPGNWEKLPDFAEMKAGKPKYGGTSKLVDPRFNPEDFAAKFFRKGKSGGWREEMSPFLQDLFWNYHGPMMERLGYETYKGSIGQNSLLDYTVMQKMGKDVLQKDSIPLKIYIEATKLIQPPNDGIKRYLSHLLKSFEDVSINGDPRWEFNLLIGQKFYPLESYKEVFSDEEVENLHHYEKVLLALKKGIKNILPQKIYNAASNVYKKTDIRILLRIIQRKSSIKQLKQFYKNIISENDSVDLLHIPLPQNIENYKTLKHTFLVTVHDLTHRLFPEYHQIENVALTESGLQFIQDKQTDIIAISKNTIFDLTSNFSIPVSNINLVYESPVPELFKLNIFKELAEAIRKKYKLSTTPYFLCLSTIEPRKNLPNTIRAFNLLLEENPNININLVISGNFGWKTEHLNEELHLDNPRIIFTGFVDDNDLHVLYSEAVALCYVSFYEGFGLPPLEAMSCRTPTIYGNNSSMKEVIGDVGLPANAHDVNQIKMQMSKMYYDKNLREELASRSLRKSFEFSWRKCVYDTLKVYESVINKHRSK
jgi:glycosyltransferase involved in cell wall biosynthesis